ncbi:hypothetical protein FGB62_19g026 [Gracilaria domingensis]|nr:hypothetical protein FGB62_19g026 [Gracilaria domingensis]
MPLSMRRQTALQKRRVQRDTLREHQRNHVLHLFRKQAGTSTILTQTRISKTTLHRLRVAVSTNNQVKLEKLLNPSINSAGRKPILGEDENALVVAHMEPASEGGFAVNVVTAKHIMGQVANDGRKPFTSSIPSDGTLRA